MNEALLLFNHIYNHHNSIFRGVLVDVGANTGGISALFAAKNWQIIAFEPEKNNFIELQKKMAQYKQSISLPKAVSDISGQKIPFYVSKEHYGIHSIKPWHKTHQPAYEVETVRLDEILEELKTSDVTVLKIDIEGADFLALKSFDFEKFHPELVMVEFMDERTKPNFNYSYHDMVKYMKDLGYMAYISEWAPIKEYGRKGEFCQHQWLQCVPYPLNHEPAWGNLIFVPIEKQQQFQQTLSKYLKELKFRFYISYIKKIPGVVFLYRFVRSMIK